MATIKIKQTRSGIHCPKDQKATLKTLGLRRMYQVVELEDTPSVQGLINKVHHLVTRID
ncbi:MAG: 50S ribosomal protein L30 [Bacteroidaceae bacterium]|nr:50S ribosomal protein L30 [Bacteroidaceae bacterium]MCF0189100.1 50S ribosomal protein L30 [Bacteroidaceae bacterium]